MTSLSGDHYFIIVNAFTDPSEEEQLEAIEQYSQFDTQRLEDKMNDIMNDDLFDAAKRWPISQRNLWSAGHLANLKNAR